VSSYICFGPTDILLHEGKPWTPACASTTWGHDGGGSVKRGHLSKYSLSQATRTIDRRSDGSIPDAYALCSQPVFHTLLEVPTSFAAVLYPCPLSSREN
jgi:hypothetical protein